MDVSSQSGTRQPTRQQLDTAECRSCHHVIIWARTVNNEMMPLDAAPVPYCRDGGNFRIETNIYPPRAINVDRINPARLFGARIYRSHFATCPQANRWRRQR